MTSTQNRVALIDRDRSFTYGELDRMSDNLALNLLANRLSARWIASWCNCPNVAEFVVLYLALQKIGGIPIAALMPHRFAEISQFVELSGRGRMRRSGAAERFRLLRHGRSHSPKDPKVCATASFLGPPRPGFLSLPEMIEKPARLPAVGAVAEIKIDPDRSRDFSAFGRHHWNSETDSAHAQRLRLQLEDSLPMFARVGEDSVLLVILPIAHNLPLACPGIQGFLFHGGRVVLSTSARAEDVCALIEKHRVTHIKVVPALLIRLLHDPAVNRHDLSSLKMIQSGGQSMLPEVRLLAKKLIPSAFVQENFGMSEGLLMFVRLDDPLDVSQETVGRPVSPDDEVRLLDDDDREIHGGEVGELCCRGPYTLRGYFGVPGIQRAHVYL